MFIAEVMRAAIAAIDEFRASLCALGNLLL